MHLAFPIFSEIAPSPERTTENHGTSPDSYQQTKNPNSSPTPDAPSTTPPMAVVNLLDRFLVAIIVVKMAP